MMLAFLLFAYAPHKKIIKILYKYKNSLISAFLAIAVHDINREEKIQNKIGIGLYETYLPLLFGTREWQILSMVKGGITGDDKRQGYRN